MVDKDGIVLFVSDKSDLPTVYGFFIPNAGSKVSLRTKLALDIIYSVNYYFRVNSAYIENETLIVELPDQIRVIFPLEGDSNVLVGSLILIINEIKKNGSEFFGFSQIQTIDLRYKNPVIRG